MEIKESIIEKLKNRFPESVVEISDFRNDLSITVKKESLLDLAKFLKDDSELLFVMCKDITAIDWATRKNRFSTIYNIYSFHLNINLRLKVNIDIDPAKVNSVVEIWPSAEWYERETFDMYGIVFENHPDLRRMYMPEGFQYHPLRKDFPVLGIPGSLPLPQKPE